VGSFSGALGLEKISKLPKGQLRRDRNPLESVRAKAGLMGFPTARNPNAKAWPSDPLQLFRKLAGVTEKLPRG
jgi:hypothetical protein